MHPTVAIILKGYPRLSETFIAQEIRALELRGISLILFSLRHPTDKSVHPIHGEIEASVRYLPEYLGDAPMRILKAWWSIRKNAGYRSARRQFFKDLKRDRSLNRIRRFGQAMVLATEMPESVEHYYSHFMHTPASVTFYASLMNARPWSISAHAKDIWTIEEWEKREKLASAEWLVTCTSANADHLSGLCDKPDKVSLLYHGLDFCRFDEPMQDFSGRDGSLVTDPVQIVSVGRAVNKKGYDYLLNALAEISSEIHWIFHHIGGGELLNDLRQQAEDLGISDKIVWHGSMAQIEVLARYRESDLFVLPSRISDNGDRDGLPNVLMEAQSQRLACLSTNISGIPELINHAETGWLVEQKNTEDLKLGLQRLITDVAFRDQLAVAGFERVRNHFSLEGGIDQLVSRLQRS
jgi:glycosyltransferase involved in cell wall biosynthesis